MTDSNPGLLFDAPGGRADVANLRKFAICPCGGDQRGGDGCTCDPPFNR